jgi:hypothetical protein
MLEALRELASASKTTSDERLKIMGKAPIYFPIPADVYLRARGEWKRFNEDSNLTAASYVALYCRVEDLLCKEVGSAEYNEKLLVLNRAMDNLRGSRTIEVRDAAARLIRREEECATT